MARMIWYGNQLKNVSVTRLVLIHHVAFQNNTVAIHRLKIQNHDLSAYAYCITACDETVKMFYGRQ